MQFSNPYSETRNKCNGNFFRAFTFFWGLPSTYPAEIKVVSTFVSKQNPINHRHYWSSNQWCYQTQAFFVCAVCGSSLATPEQANVQQPMFCFSPKKDLKLDGNFASHMSQRVYALESHALECASASSSDPSSTKKSKASINQTWNVYYWYWGAWKEKRLKRNRRRLQSSRKKSKRGKNKKKRKKKEGEKRKGVEKKGIMETIVRERKEENAEWQDIFCCMMISGDETYHETDDEAV